MHAEQRTKHRLTTKTRATTLTPSEFARFVLGERDLYPWQIEALEAIGLQETSSIDWVALVAANGSGKTAKVVALAILWFLARYPRGQCVITSGSFRQVEKQLWPALRVHRHKFPEWNFLQTEVKTPEGGFALGFSTDDAGRAEGWHPKVSASVDPVFIIVDEAKTVPDSVFEAFDRCTRRFQLWTSSPGMPRGQFYDAFHASAAAYHKIKVTSFDCPHIDPEKRRRDLLKYGEDHPTYRSMHLAEFTDDDGRLIITPQGLAAAIQTQPPQDQIGEIVGFCDFAAGRDENVLAIRRGNTVRIIKAWHERDTVQATRQFAKLFRENGLEPWQLWGDAGGLGVVMLHELREMGWPINHFHGGNPSTEPTFYRNLISEVWHVGAREIVRGRINVGQLDDVTFRQMTTRKSEWAEDSTLRAEDKDRMRKEGVPSPDRADAFLGAIVCGRRLLGGLAAEDFTAPDESPAPSGWR